MSVLVRSVKKVISTDEKKFNLDGPDGYNIYLHYLQKEKRVFSREHSRTGGVIVWGAISYYVIVDLFTLNFQRCCLSKTTLKCSSESLRGFWAHKMDPSAG